MTRNRNRQQEPLKINSRASEWAKIEDENVKSASTTFQCDSRRSHERAKETWAAVRSEQTRKAEHGESRMGHGRDRHTERPECVDGDAWRKASKSYSFDPDFKHCFGKKSGIRREWEKIDHNHSKSELEKEMEHILIHLEKTEVGMLSTTSAPFQVKLPDGEGGETTETQELYLTVAAFKIMESWRYHKFWTSHEARIAGKILLRMEREEIFGDGEPVDKQTYISVINAYSKVTTEDETASIRADNLLDHMENRSLERPDLKPDRMMINTVMGAQAKHALSGSLSIENIAAAERMLTTLEREYAMGDTTMQPTARTYSKFIDLYAKHGMANEASEALERMEYQYRHGNRAALPSTIHYTNVIDAYAKCAGSSVKAARCAEDTLLSMLELYDAGNEYLKPDSIVFSATIDAYAKSKRQDATERSLKLLDLMDYYKVLPDIITYNVVLNTLSHNPSNHSEAKRLLKYIEDDPRLTADSFTYNAVIKGCHPSEAENLIQHWELEYMKGHVDERPDSYTYTALINSWIATNTIGYEEKCLKILQWMEENEVVGMNRIAYNEVMRGFSRSIRDNAGDLAEEVFGRLVARYEQTGDKEFRPDRFSYMTILNAYCRSCRDYNYALKAEDVLFQMMESNHFPDTKLCGNVVSAWARSGSGESIFHAENICSRMDKLGIHIDTVVFNCLINVYAKSYHPNKSVESLQVLERMLERGVDPTSVTYSSLLEACLEDEECLLQVFESCIDHGMLDEKLQLSFKKHGPACVQELMNGKIDRSWVQNANRGPGGLSRAQLKEMRKEGSTGADVRKFGWAR